MIMFFQLIGSIALLPHPFMQFDVIHVFFTSPFQTKLFLATVEEDGQAGEGRREMAETLLSALTDRHQQRQTWRDR